MMSASVSVASVFLLREDGAVLLQHRDDKPGLPHANMWVTPGGHTERGESSEACARREFLEETSYVCGALRWLENTHVFLDEPQSFSLAVFWARFDGVQSPVCLEGQALEFVRRQDADAYRIPAFILPLWNKALAAFRKTAPGIPS